MYSSAIIPTPPRRKAGLHVAFARAAEQWIPACTTDQVRGLKARGKALCGGFIKGGSAVRPVIKLAMTTWSEWCNLIGTCSQPALALSCTQMIQCNAPVLVFRWGPQPTDLFRREGRDPFLPWAPPFGGVTGF